VAEGSITVLKPPHLEAVRYIFLKMKKTFYRLMKGHVVSLKGGVCGPLAGIVLFVFY
jgi:hypothetical protein